MTSRLVKTKKGTRRVPDTERVVPLDHPQCGSDPLVPLLVPAGNNQVESETDLHTYTPAQAPCPWCQVTVDHLFVPQSWLRCVGDDAHRLFPTTDLTATCR